MMISTHMNHRDLRSLAVTSQSICRLLLPEYLRRRHLVLRDTCAGGLRAQLLGLSGYASLGLWSVASIFHPPEEMYCSIPRSVQEAQTAIEFLMHFLLQPSNTCNLRDFYFSLRGTNSLRLASEFVKMRRLFNVLPLTRLTFSGYDSADCLPPSITLRSGTSCSSHTLTSLVISSDYAFAPGLVQTTMGILRHSPIKDLMIYMVSLNPPQWSTLLGELNMAFLEDVDLEGDIPRPALIRFLIKNKGLRNVIIRGNVRSDRLQPSRSRSQPILPNLLTLRAPLEVCCAIIEQVSHASRLYELQIEVSRLHPHHEPSFLRLVEKLQHFRKLDHLGFHLPPSSPSAIPQTVTNPNDYDWNGHPAHVLKQVRTLSFSQRRGQLSHGDIVCRHLPSPHISHLTQMIGHNVCLHTIISDAGNSPCGRRRGRTQSGTPRHSAQGETRPPHCRRLFRSSPFEVDSGCTRRVSYGGWSCWS